jgi:hypothetical protein
MTAIAAPSPLRDFVLRHLRVWPKFFWGNSDNSELHVHDGGLQFTVTGFYGVSVGPSFLGFVNLQRKRAYSIGTPGPWVAPGRPKKAA